MSDRSDKSPLAPYLWSLMWRFNLTLPESLYLYRGRQRWGRGEEQLIRILFRNLYRAAEMEGKDMLAMLRSCYSPVTVFRGLRDAAHSPSSIGSERRSPT
jgi:hypothetical protein